MGINPTYAQFIGEAVSAGARLGRALTIGRLDLHLRPSDRARIIAQHGAGPANPDADGDWGFAEPFLQALGAASVESLDISDYEGATVLHDLNQPISEEFHERFDAVCEGGTLEHVFWFPEALRSCMQLLKVGGDLFLSTPANNFGGHGFFQVSPDLYYRALSPANGFEVRRMVVQEQFHLGRRYEVTRPEDIAGRVEYQSDYCPLLLLIWARRVERKPIFADAPQQTDYAIAWEERGAPRPRQTGLTDRQGPKKILDQVEKHMPGLLRYYHTLKARRMNAARFGLDSQPGKFRKID